MLDEKIILDIFQEVGKYLNRVGLDAGENFHVLEAQSAPLDLNCLTEDFRDELKREDVLTFEIDSPTENFSP